MLLRKSSVELFQEIWEGGRYRLVYQRMGRAGKHPVIHADIDEIIHPMDFSVESHHRCCGGLKIGYPMDRVLGYRDGMQD